MNRALVLRRIPAVVIAAAVFAALFVAWQVHTRLSHDRQIVYFMSRECHPVWKDLHSGRIHAGQSVDEVINLTKPIRVEHFENYDLLHYQDASFTGVAVIARDGRLIAAEAWSCTWNKTFFKNWKPADESAFSTRYDAHRRALRQADQPTSPESETSTSQ
jgi:hypothetical protein